jgi:hypothetical protein
MKAPARPSRMPQQIPIAEIFYNPSTGYFGYRFRFEGRPPHYVRSVPVA